MKSRPSRSGRARCFFIPCATAAIAAFLLPSASAGDQPTSSAPAGSKPAPVPPAGKTGVQLWSESCGRCHNIRAQNSLSPAQWEVVMLHMRVRANLPADEARRILEFLKSGH